MLPGNVNTKMKRGFEPEWEEEFASVERNKQNSLFKNPNVIEGILREPYQ
jgi:hypothetical protein